MEFEEVRYGMLMMVICDREGRVYDVWITFGSVQEDRAFRERKKRSLPKNTLTCFQKHLRSMQFYSGISFFGDDDMIEWGELVIYVTGGRGRLVVEYFLPGSGLLSPPPD